MVPAHGWLSKKLKEEEKSNFHAVQFFENLTKDCPIEFYVADRKEAKTQGRDFPKMR